MPQGLFHAITMTAAMGPVDLVVIQWDDGGLEISAINGACVPTEGFVSALAFIDRTAAYPGLREQIETKIKREKHENN